MVKSSKNDGSASVDDPHVASNLKHLVQDKPDFPETKCPWRLSGLQFPLPLDIQKQYCHPEGTQEYSNKKSGALWTVYDNDGVFIL